MNQLERGAPGWPEYACPVCRTPVVRESSAAYRCPSDGIRYPLVDGIWRFLPAPQVERHAPFIRAYETVRRAEGRAAKDAAYHRSLPFTPRSDAHHAIWRVRAQSYRTLLRRVVQPLARAAGKPLRVLDLGAGTGWLAYRLVEAGHHAAAVDVLTNVWDGLGAWVHFGAEAGYTPVQASFDRLPFIEDECDLIVFNGALHYSADYEATLREALRVLQPHGRIVIMDSPLYRRASSGVRMVEQRNAQFRQDYGVEVDGLTAENFLTHDRLKALGEALRLRWRRLRPYRGTWALRWGLNRLRMDREPARFPVIVGHA